MKWNKRFNYPKSLRSNEDGLRKYLFDDEKLPSVTSILDATKPEEDKAALANWRERTGEELANKIQKEAASRGTMMHKYLEDYLQGRINLSFFESNEQHKLMAKEIIDKGISSKLDEIWGVETTLYYPGKYAGTADCVGIYEGKETIIDFKQSNKPKKIDYIESWLLQISAYSLAHNVVYGTNITLGLILMCTKDNFFQEFKIENEVLIAYQNLFLGRLKKFNEMNNIA